MTRKKSADILAITGTKRPDRHAPRSTEGAAIGTAPRHLDDDLRKIWRELAAALPKGVGSRHDRQSFELLARLVHKSRTGSVTAAEVAHMRGLFSDFGLTPMGRVRLNVRADTPEKPPGTDSTFRF